MPAQHKRERLGYLITSQSNGHGKRLGRAAGQVLSEGLGLVDGALLALRVVRVDDGRLRVPGGLATAEALASTTESSPKRLL